MSEPTKFLTRIKSGLTGQEYGLSLTNSYETIIVSLKAPSEVDWTQYTVAVYNTTTSEAETIYLNGSGIVSFQIPYGDSYTITLPTVSSWIMPATISYTAGQQLRTIYYTYMMQGVFGIDANGIKYTLSEISNLDDPSIILYGGYNDVNLENSSRQDGTTGNGFMWVLENGTTSGQWASANTQFDTDLLPFVTNDTTGLNNYCGYYNTAYIISEASRLNLTTSAASNASSRSITVGGVLKTGYIPAYGQLRRLAINITSFNALYAAVGKTAPTITSGNWWTSCQYSSSNAVLLYNGGFSLNLKPFSYSVLVGFDL